MKLEFSMPAHWCRSLGVMSIALVLFFAGISSSYAQVNTAGKQHMIQMSAEELDGGYLAYKMIKHEITDSSGTTDVTSRYSSEATMPGPTIVMAEGDVADIELFHAIDAGGDPDKEHVSLHVHGVHYDIVSDGTLKYINLFKDESATPVMSYTYRWDAELGTAGSWAYHDHNFNTHNGAEDRGLYGALIVNPASGVIPAQGSGQQGAVSVNDIERENVLYIIDDAFAGMQINNADQKQTPLQFNPTFTASKNALVRFHLIVMGTNLHEFEMPSYGWLDPGTNRVISKKALGPLEKHTFVVRATHDADYMNATLFGRLLGMTGKLVTE